MVNEDKLNASQYKNLIETVFFVPSELSVGIQLADMVAGSVFRKVEKDDNRFFARISGSIRTSPQGKLEGYGLVKVPRG